MNQFITFIFSIIIASNLYSQPINMDAYNNEQKNITKHGITILGAWGGANLIYNGLAVGYANGSDKYFYQMNLIWGSVNFSFGAIGYFLSKNYNGLTYFQSLKKQLSVEKIFLFNTGLDIAYVVGGFYIKERAGDNLIKAYRNKGYGESIILQGSALFFFDGIMYLIHQRHGKKLYSLANKIQIGATLNGISCTVKL